jgi:hypothetical protein
MTVRDAGLAVRLAFGGDRSARIRLVMMIGGVAVGVALLLGVIGALPAAAERINKTVGRGVVPAGEEQRTEGVRAALSVGFWRGHDIRILLVEVVGSPVAPPPGVPRTPQPGEVFVSPALAAALAGEHAAELAPRLPGATVGVVTRAGLVGPEELYAVAGAAPGTLDRAVPGSATASPLSPGFERPAGDSLLGSQRAHVDGTGSASEANAVSSLILVVGLAGVGLVIPLLILVAASTRLSAASRERRAGAMRLVGATARQLRLFGAVEAAVIGVLGALAGAGLFLLLRSPAAGLLPIQEGLYAADISPPPVAVLVVLLGVPALTAVAGRVALRRAVSSPLGIRRQAAPARADVRLLIPLGAGLALLAMAYADRAAIRAGALHGQILLFGGAALCLVGLAVGAAPLARVAGIALSRWGRGPASQLAGRRLIADAAGSARTVTGTAMVVVLLGWVMALLPTFDEPPAVGDEAYVATLRPHTLVVTVGSGADLKRSAATLGAVPGVRDVATIRHVNLRLPGVDQEEQSVRGLIADCADLSRMLRTPLTGCDPATPQYLSASYVDASMLTAARRLQPVDQDGEPAPGPALKVPAELTTVEVPASIADRNEGLSMGGDLLIPPALMPSDDADTWVPSVIVATDGLPETREAVRAALGAQHTPFAALTAEETLGLSRAAANGYTGGATIVVIIALLVAGMSLAVATADGIRERRRAHSALTAIGTPPRVLRRSVLLQTALPLLLVVGLAVVVTAATSWLYLRISAPETATPPLPWDGYAAIGGAALLACLLATAATLPFIRATIRPDSLRTE